MTVPLLLPSIRSASRRMAKWPERVGLAREKCSARSPAVMGFFRSKCRICRRVGSESALKTKFIVRYLAKYGRMSSAIWKRDGTAERQPLRERQSMSALGQEQSFDPGYPNVRQPIADIRGMDILHCEGRHFRPG